jgi:hypothetical protein
VSVHIGAAAAAERLAVHINNNSYT